MTRKQATKPKQPKPKQPKPSTLMLTLDVALSLACPHNAAPTYAFTCWLQAALPKRLRDIAFFDAVNNLHIDNRVSKTQHRTLFVAHVDTVHRKAGHNHIIKTDAKWSAGTPGQCLGADDGAGVALLMHMLDANVPGYYIFTQGEEVGGIGARHLAREHALLLAEFDRAVAFDRKGFDSVITHQGFNGRCCSDEFALALADALNATNPDMLMLSPDDTGVYTDTAEFVDIIPECTNISVGYSHAHGDKEELDMVYFAQLARSVLMVAWDGLPTTRDPLLPDAYEDVYDKWGPGQWFDIKPKPTSKASKASKAPPLPLPDTRELDLFDAIQDARLGMCGPLLDMMAHAAYPEDIALARNQISKRALTEEVLDWAEMSLDDGVPVDIVLEDLFTGAQIH